MNKKILLFNQVSGPLFIDIANAFISENDDVTLVTGAIEPASVLPDKRIKIIKKCKYIRNKTYLRISTWILFFCQSLFYLFFKKGNYKILVVSNPPILPFITSFLSYKKNFEYDVLIYDVYPDALSTLNYIKKDSFLFQFWDRMNTNLYQKANRVCL